MLTNHQYILCIFIRSLIPVTTLSLNEPSHSPSPITYTPFSTIPYSSFLFHSHWINSTLFLFYFIWCFAMIKRKIIYMILSLFLFCYLFLRIYIYAIRCLLLLLLFSHHRFLLLPRTSKTYAIGQQEELPITYSAVAKTTTTTRMTTTTTNS